MSVVKTVRKTDSNLLVISTDERAIFRDASYPENGRRIHFFLGREDL